ncbi:MAG: tRNA (adenosine(37)-N6)-threonylcarbamoyltransferase complex transferase subunit TsaD [Clostridiales bacterium]|jgi:N6-L-threonylcarbamoyladenine synthase|nr:tRNA (adenosine(37)-N6)-threonylcarbamoyltransferase complex transferase subunit TsaD [Clostridiales bacterium]
MYDVTQKLKALKAKRHIVVLGIESSCDETAAAVVRDGRTVLSGVISSQIEIHRRFGGVVPEVASRNHTLAVNAVIGQALGEAGLALGDIDAVAVTCGAGLLGALLVGVSAAKALCFAAGLPLVRVNHIEAHIAACYVARPELKPPFTALVASGGHTHFIDAAGYNEFYVRGGTVDDAIGEAFDKVARVLGLPYPGGPELDRLSKSGTPRIPFYKHKKTAEADLSLSYSGLKTAAVQYIHNARSRGETLSLPDIAASLTAAAVDILVDTALLAARRDGRRLIALCGGVAANSYLRGRLTQEAKAAGIDVCLPPPGLCTDNAVMVAARGYYGLIENQNIADLTLNAHANLRAGTR